MLTIFTTAKPFRGHFEIIQRNALKSWTLLHPDIQIILFGDDPGAGEIARDLRIQHQPFALKTAYGAMRVDYMFARAQELSRFNLCCYINCDIILLQDFCAALRRTVAAYPHFLMVGRRWDLDITEPLPFHAPDWQARLAQQVRQSARQRTPDWIDYFAFSRGVLGRNLPPLAIGRPFWDNWLVWKVLAASKPVVDASEVVLAVHQNHDYSHHHQGEKGVWHGEDQRVNFQLIGGHGHLRTIANAPYRLTPSGFAPNRLHRIHYWLTRGKHFGILVVTKFQSYVWHPILDFTRPLRNAVGLRRSSIE
jgi:hypothetical protein